MKKNLTIRSRLFLTIAVILVSSYVLLFFLSLLSLERFTEEEITKDLESSLKFAKIEFNERPTLILQALKMPVSSAFVQNLFISGDVGALKEAAVRWTKTLENPELLTLIDARQNVIVRANGKTGNGSFLRGHLLDSLFDRRQPFITTELVSHDQYCQEVSAEICQSLPEQKHVMVQLIFVPVLDRHEKVIGAVVTGEDINKNPHLPYLQQQVIGKSVEMLITQHGERIASNMSGPNILPTNLEEKVLRALKNGYSFNGTTSLHGVECEMIAEPINNHKGEFIGSIAVALGKNRFISIRHENLINLMVSGGISITLIFILAYFTSRQFAIPMRRFIDTVKAVEEGDYSRRLTESGGHEFKALADSFNRMVEVLGERDNIIGSQNRELVSLNEQLEARVAARTEQFDLEIGIQKAIVKSLSDGLIITDGQKKIIQMNPVAEKLLLKDASGLIGESVLKICKQPGLFELEKVLAGSRTSGSESGTVIAETVEYRNKRLKFSISDLRDENGCYRGLLLGIRDVTADEEVDRLKSDFIAKVSHELKTPLTSMKGSLEYILKRGKWLTGVEREMLSVCLRNTERLISLVASILELSKIEAGQTVFAKRPLLIGEVTLYALEENKFAALQKNISLVNDISLDLPKIYGDFDRLGQVLSNLISNAIKFSPNDSTVHLSAESSGGQMAISVTDGGRLIAGEDRETLFSKFQQVGRQEDGNLSGSGLGLAICKEIVDRHGGTIYHAPAASGGNVFTFSIPLYGVVDGKE